MGVRRNTEDRLWVCFLLAVDEFWSRWFTSTFDGLDSCHGYSVPPFNSLAALLTLFIVESVVSNLAEEVKPHYRIKAALNIDFEAANAPWDSSEVFLGRDVL